MGDPRASRCGLVLCAALGLAGCGEAGERTNRERPPAPVNVSAAIIDGRVLLSPTTVGTGPIRLIITNQSAAPQSVTLEASDRRSSPATTRTTDPIGPRATATLAADVVEGAYTVRTNDRRIKPAALGVGARRPSAQHELLLP